MNKLLLIILLMFAGAAGAEEYLPLTSSAQRLAITTTSTSFTNPIGAQTRLIRVVTTQDAFLVTSSTNVTVPSTVTSYFLKSGIPDTIKVSPNSYISIRASSTAGDAYMVELTK